MQYKCNKMHIAIIITNHRCQPNAHHLVMNFFISSKRKHYFYQTDQARLSQRTCLSPVALIQMYAPDQLNGEHRSNPIYRSSVAPENDDDDHHQHKHHHHQHENADYHDTDFGISNIQITPQNLLAMCPALLVQIEQGSCNDAAIAAATATAAAASAAASAAAVTASEPMQHPTPRKEIKEISSFGKVNLLYYFMIAIHFHWFKDQPLCMQ